MTCLQHILVIVGLSCMTLGVDTVMYGEDAYIYVILDKVYPMLMAIGYNLLYYVSICQIQINKTYKFISSKLNVVCKYLEKNGIISETTNKILILIDDNGNEIKRINVVSEEIVKNQCKNISYSGLILLDKNDETGCINRVFYETFPETFEYTKSNVHFVSIELDHGGNSHPISLKNDTHNYYIVNNPLNQNFFKYYLKNILKVQIKDDNFDYSIRIIDHNVNFVDLLPHQHIIIEEHDYKIYPTQTQSNLDNDTNKDDDTKKDDDTNKDDDKQEVNSISEHSDDYVKLEVDN